MKKTALSIVLIMVLCVTCLAGCQVPAGNDDGELDATAASIFTLDINPSVKVYLDENETVITVEGANEDGEAIVAEIDVDGETYEAAVEEILDKVVEEGYATEEETSVLVSVEKQTEEIKAELSEKLNEKINHAFEKHGKHARIIEQEIDELEESVKEELEELAERYDISKGKANVIEKIRGEFPELSEEDLAGLKMSDLSLILGETGEDVQKHFKKFEKALEDVYVGAENAIAAALADISTEELTVTEADVEHLRAYISRDDGKMIYEVKFVYGGNEYEYEISAESGEILEKEIEEHEEIDIEEEIDKFLDENHDFIKDMLEDKKDEYGEMFDQWMDKNDGYRDQIKDAIFGEGGKDEKKECIGRTDALEAVIEKFAIDADKIEKTDVKVSKNEKGALVFVEIETTDGDEYKVLVEAFTATVIKAELNGEALNVSAEVNSEATPEQPAEDSSEAEESSEEQPVA